MLCEVGNLSDLLLADDRAKFDELIQEAFEKAGATEHGAPQIFWSGGETVAAFRAEVPSASWRQMARCWLLTYFPLPCCDF